LTRVIPIALGERSYEVLIGAGLVARAGELISPLAASKRVFVVTDENVEALHGAALKSALEAGGLEVAMNAVLPPGEQTKSFRWLEWLTARLLEHGVERRDVVVAFGGGVVGDLAGFAAGIVKRGVDFVQMPTTLLAQVDSSVGGKTAIDTEQGKNLVGLFNQPRLVLADLDVLATLPEREARAGYAEIVKIGLIEDAAFFAWCEAHAGALLAADAPARAHAIHFAVAAKAAIVAADEKEQGKRALLNLGHTFAHALEAHGGYGAGLLHGEAVAAGMALAFRFAAQHGLCPRADAERVSAHLNAAGFITDLHQLSGAPFDPVRLAGLMAADKKNEGGQLTLILPRAIGDAFVQKHANAAAVAAFLQQATQ
jgi:3-dehydroquinate synthase